uniref:CUB domain-containing protein n=1 Tax=Branchiostoma floridae TaxID=7739 RepID=C3Y305_BRAFL|eukprot:XP_002609407.1 hypothetical protein BRAFLDRAFT_86509 [Branchiostoma floridae]
MERYMNIPPVHNTRMTMQRISSFQVNHHFQCSQLCYLTSGCQSYNYRKQDGSCELSKVTRDDSMFVTKQEEGWDYYERYSAIISRGYDNGTWCDRNVAVAEGHVVEFTFDPVFQLEHQRDCLFDYVQLIESGNQTTLGRYCGDNYPEGPIISSGPEVTIEFRSDDTIGGSGFLVHWRTVLKDACATKHTDTVVHYKWDLPPLTGPPFTFEVKCTTDAYVVTAPLNQTAELDNMYTVIIGGWGGTKSRISRHGSDTELVSTPDILSPTQYRAFWLSWDSDGTIAVGRGGETDPFMRWVDPNPLPIGRVGYSTGYGNTGQWTFCPTVRHGDIITEKEYRGFWISWDPNGTVAVGKAGENNPFLRLVDTEPLPITHVGYTTASGTGQGQWNFCPELPRGGRPRDCSDVLKEGHQDSGIYVIYPHENDGGRSIGVFCDMDTDGGGWTVFQRRRDGSEDFYRGWSDYKAGFGKLDEEFWLGNDKLHQLTSQAQYELRVDLEDFEGNSAYAQYQVFTVGSKADQYRLNVGGYSGTAVMMLIL